MISSIELGGTGKSAQFISRHSFSPWNIPASMRIRRPGRSMRYLEPVTVPAAPRNVSDIATMSSRWHRPGRPVRRPAGLAYSETPPPYRPLRHSVLPLRPLRDRLGKARLAWQGVGALPSAPCLAKPVAEWAEREYGVAEWAIGGRSLRVGKSGRST